MNLTTFTFFKNTPFTNFQDTIHFESNTERDNFFLRGNFYESFESSVGGFNFIRDRGTLRTNFYYNALSGVNYCTFLSDFEPNTRYYAYVVEYRYVSVQCTELTLIIDPIMTFTQGTVLNNVGYMQIDRQHVTQATYETYLNQFRTNDDILQTTTNRYVHQQRYAFLDFMILFTCASDLSIESYGTANSPKYNSSKGGEYDKITSPLNLYVVDPSNFNTLMSLLAPYPWITQNIKSVVKVPYTFINESDLEPVTLRAISFTNLYIMKDGGKSTPGSSFINELAIDSNEFEDILRINFNTEKHLFRSGYFTIEAYSFDGQQLAIDPAKMGTDDLYFYAKTCLGYYNEIAIYLDAYDSDISREPTIRDFDNNLVVPRGSFLNSAIIFKNFDEIPVLIDNYTLQLANTANQRQLNEDRLISSRIQQTFSPETSLRDKFYNVVSLVSNISPWNILGKFNDEYEYYRTQKAVQADLALTPPTITAQTNTNSFNLANDIWGIVLKLSAPNNRELNQLRKYYNYMGFSFENEKLIPEPLNSMSVCNYLKATGNFVIPNVDTNIMEQLRIQIENGVRFWRNNNTANPMTQDILNNTRVL